MESHLTRTRGLLRTAKRTTKNTRGVSSYPYAGIVTFSVIFYRVFCDKPSHLTRTRELCPYRRPLSLASGRGRILSACGDAKTAQFFVN